MSNVYGFYNKLLIVNVFYKYDSYWLYNIVYKRVFDNGTNFDIFRFVGVYNIDENRLDSIDDIWIEWLWDVC